jgi:hypothetical protein
LSDELKQGPAGPVGPTGPRGPAGPIDACVNASKTAFEQAIAAHSVLASAREQGFRDEIKALRKEQADFKAHLSEYIQNYVDNAVVKVLEAYGVVSDLDGRRITAK